MTEATRRNLELWLSPVLWCALIFLLSSVPGGGSSPLEEWAFLVYPRFLISKSCHIAEYFILFVLCRRALTEGAGIDARLAGLAGFIFCVFYGFSDEIHQTYVSGRNGRITDVIIDAVGALAARNWYRR